jgi:hypothetical protein
VGGGRLAPPLKQNVSGLIKIEESYHLLSDRSGGNALKIIFRLSEAEDISLMPTIRIPTNFIPGQYELLLNLPDSAGSLYSMPMYSIRLANELVWEEDTGYNNLLHPITVTEPAISPEFNNTALNVVCNMVYLPTILKS